MFWKQDVDSRKSSESESNYEIDLLEEKYHWRYSAMQIFSGNEETFLEGY
jgi:hypothetical protein